MSLPSELDFELDREASPARMNRAMEYLYLLGKAGIALQPQFQTAIDELNAVGLTRLNEVLTPIFLEAEQIAADLAATKADWLTGDPLTDLIAELEANATAAIAAVAPQLAAQDAAVAGQLAASNAAVTAVNAALAALNASIATLTAADTALTARINAERTRSAFISGGF